VKIFLDTNVLVYAYDPADPPRQKQAIHILDHLHIQGNGVLSTQVLGEFFSAIIRPFRGMPPRLTTAEALHSVEVLSVQFEVLPLTTMNILEAGRAVRDHQLAYYDAQIWATARLNQITIIFSEDFQDQQVLEGVRFINPFSSKFKLNLWITET
jgi:predicted nucleic acid-binding protein